MTLLIHIKEAFANLSSAKLRSFLAILGILVGTGSVVAMVSGGQLATQHALEQFQELGTDLLAVGMFSKGQSSSEGGQLTLDNIYQLQDNHPEAEIIAPYTTVFLPVSFAGEKLTSNIIGATGSLQDVIKITMTHGRFISSLDKYSSFAVIGHDLAKKLQKMGVSDPTEMQIQLGDRIFTIVGVADEWPENSFFNQDINKAVIIPLEIAYHLSSYAQINNLVMRLQENIDIDDLQQSIEADLKRLNPDLRIFIRSAKQLIKSMTSQQQTLTLLLALIGSISLIVGGIGVMNIMLVSVVERRREIGIRKAVGARSRDIQWLFLIEAITLTVFGGLLGVMLGVLASYFISLFADWTFTIFFLPAFVGFVVSVAIGVFFGFYPAYKASRLDPIETLRAD